MSNVVDVVLADRNLATMSKSVKAAGLDTILSQKGPFTIFAPTETAFSKLDEGRLQELLTEGNQEELAELLNAHVVEGLTNIRDLSNNQKLVARNGVELNIKVTEGKVTVNGASIQGRGFAGSNGVVHTVDTVIEMKHT